MNKTIDCFFPSDRCYIFYFHYQILTSVNPLLMIFIATLGCAIRNSRTEFHLEKKIRSRTEEDLLLDTYLDSAEAIFGRIEYQNRRHQRRPARLIKFPRALGTHYASEIADKPAAPAASHHNKEPIKKKKKKKKKYAVVVARLRRYPSSFTSVSPTTRLLLLHQTCARAFPTKIAGV